jgi:hypothetical protein
MTELDAAVCGSYATELFRYVTKAQATEVARWLQRIPDEYVDTPHGKEATGAAADLGKAILIKLAGNNPDPEQRLSITAVAEAVRSELGKRGLTSDQQRWRTGNPDYFQKHWGEIDEAIFELTDEELDELRPFALAYLNDGAKRMLEKIPVRDSRTLRGLVFKVLEERKLAHVFD